MKRYEDLRSDKKKEETFPQTKQKKRMIWIYMLLSKHIVYLYEKVFFFF
jgi:hypothetical protein